MKQDESELCVSDSPNSSTVDAAASTRNRATPRAGLRDVYAQKALSQVPRLLSLQDRNEFSRTYGCFNREYWLCRTTDFPSSIAQFGVQSLALAWATPFPDNPYYRSPKILQWTLAAIEYWMQIQKSDGSFDEFYPNERGWAGPTGFLVYAMARSYRLVKEHVTRDFDERFLSAVAKAGHFLAKYDEPGVLANHHAMAILPIYEAYDLTRDEKIRQGFDVRLEDFLDQSREEGWCLEYDGTDLGYLSATVSFLAKLHRLYRDDRTEQVCQRAIEFASYFVYPNGHYAGSMGSRQTLHFYPHGFEVYGGDGNALASAVAERLLLGLKDGALVPPEIQEDRYFLYRIPELMESWIDYSARPAGLPQLPYEREPFQRYWPGAQCYARKTRDIKGRESYTLVNLAKGGVIKHFRTDTLESVENDCGLLAERTDGKIVTSQWISPTATATFDESAQSLEVSTPLHYMVMKLFNPVTMIGFRVFMLAFGWQTRLAYEIKGAIRKLLMTRSGASPARMTRRVEFGDAGFTITDTIEKGSGPSLRRGLLGDEFHVRYVPQSRYFQPQELGMRGHHLTAEEVDTLARTGQVEVRRFVDYHEGVAKDTSRVVRFQGVDLPDAGVTSDRATNGPAAPRSTP